MHCMLDSMQLPSWSKVLLVPLNTPTVGYHHIQLYAASQCSTALPFVLINSGFKIAAVPTAPSGASSSLCM